MFYISPFSTELAHTYGESQSAEEPSAVPQPLAGGGTSRGVDRVGRQKRSVPPIDFARRELSSRLLPKYVVANLEPARLRWGPAPFMDE